MSKLFYKYGSMNSGKTTTLLQVIHNYEHSEMNILLIKPKVDTKGNDKVVSRLGLERKVDLILDRNDKVMEKLTQSKPNAIIVDEAQFLTSSQVDELYYITKKYDVPVLCYGLRCDFQMVGFEGSTRLLQIADDISEMKTICKCGSKATQNMRLINGKPTFNGNQIAIDDNDNIKYQSVCGKCYIKIKEKK